MDGERFDTLTRALAAAPTRRQTLKLLGAGLGAALATAFGFQRPDNASAHAPISSPTGSRRQGPVCIRAVKLWINAFIRRDIPGLTRVVPGTGPHAGKTMSPSPLPIVARLNDCFLTDNRDFSPDPNADSKIHSEVTIDLVNRVALPGQEGQIGYHRQGYTTEVDCESGDQECHAPGSFGTRFFSELRILSEVPLRMLIEFDVTTNPGCWPLTPDELIPNIDYRGHFIIEPDPSTGDVLVEVMGLVDDFPSYEIYAAPVLPNGSLGRVQALYQKNEEPGKTPLNLVGEADIPIICENGVCQTVLVSCQAPETCCPESDRCTNLDSDSMNCGECGKTCTPQQQCVNGMCQDFPPITAPAKPPGPAPVSPRCPSGVNVCGGVCCAPAERCCNNICTNTMESQDHCGFCSSPCKTDRRCHHGSCLLPCGDKYCIDSDLCCGGKSCCHTALDVGCCGDLCLPRFARCVNGRVVFS